MNNNTAFNVNHLKALTSIVGVFLLLIIWVVLKWNFNVSDRYLPSIIDVIKSTNDIKPNILYHILITFSRLLVGFTAGIVIGISLGICLFKYELLSKLLMPSIQALRAIPPIATVPFFILWFGFSEYGRYLLVIMGVSFNLAISTYQILNEVPEKFSIVFKSYNQSPKNLILEYAIPVVAENILPTIRFALSIAIGLVIVSELLGSQLGLGYLIQTARSTFSMHVIFLATIILGVINCIFDFFLKAMWGKIVFWR